MRFEFTTADRIVFGEGVLTEAGPLARSLGRRALVVTGASVARAEPLVSALKTHAVETVVLSAGGEPTVERVCQGAECARAEGCDLVIGFGGGSALDAAKAIAVLITNGGELMDYLEVIGAGRPLTKPGVSCLVLPTTAGSGTEATRNAVLTSPGHRLKVSLRSSFILPTAALVDPELSYDLPPELTASTGLDALSQLIEPYVCVRANPLVDALCVEGMRRVARSLRRACEHGRDTAARADMALASLFSGLALANAGLGAVHGFAAPIGGMFSAPHGAVCATLLPHVMEANVRALRQRQMTDRNPLQRYDEVARVLTGRPHASSEEGIDWVRSLCEVLAIPGLSAYGVTHAAVPLVAEKAAQATSMKANPITLTRQEMEDTLVAAL